MSENQLIIDYTDHFAATLESLILATYYAGIMIDAFNNLLCSKLCWHYRPGLNKNTYGAKKERPIRSSSYLTIAIHI